MWPRIAMSVAGVVVSALMIGPGGAAEVAPAPLPNPPEDARCPVCGMYVAEYPEWTASVSFHGGDEAFFDGPKDLFKFLFNLKKYTDGKSRADVRSIRVTGYYDLAPIDAENAFFVKGSDVYGPMGRELVPFASSEEASEFSRDHHGKEILRLPEITPRLIAELD